MFRFIKDIVRLFRIYILRLLYQFSPSLPLSDNSVIIAPHPDDEVIGCAGLIQRLIEQGFPPHVIIMTGGEGSHRDCCDVVEDEIKKERRALTLKVAEILRLPISHVHFFDYLDEHIHISCSETESLRKLILDLSPKSIFVPHWGEGMVDHIQTSKIVKTIVAGKNVSVYEYCVWMWYYNVWNLDFKSARILKMSLTQHQGKLMAINHYLFPKAPCGNPWSGILPRVFLSAVKWNRELYFQCKEN